MLFQGTPVYGEIQDFQSFLFQVFQKSRKFFFDISGFISFFSPGGADVNQVLFAQPVCQFPDSAAESQVSVF